MKNFLLFLFFICIGVTTEVVFVAITNFLNNEPLCGSTAISLAGKSYIWMCPIYALIPLFGKILYPKVGHYPFAIRLIIYLLCVYSVEFSAGFLLKQLNGTCPWEYQTGWHIMGLIRLDYAPMWAVFCICIERLYLDFG
jgi:hypothetical protein